LRPVGRVGGVVARVSALDMAVFLVVRIWGGAAVRPAARLVAKKAAIQARLAINGLLDQQPIIVATPGRAREHVG
jgi:hypothetical protein